MDSKSIQRLRELERENARLKRIVADQMLDITMLPSTQPTGPADIRTTDAAHITLHILA